MKNANIGTIQAASVIITVMISHIILNMPNHLISTTGPSTILNLVYVFVIALGIFYIASKIFDLFPGQDMLDICEFTGGKFLKNAFGTVTIIYFIIVSGFVIRTFAESLVLIYFPNIDLEIVIISFIAICVIMNMFGFKAISRGTLITMPIILIGIVIIFISSSSNFIPQRAFPLLGYSASNTFLTGLRKYICI